MRQKAVKKRKKGILEVWVGTAVSEASQGFGANLGGCSRAHCEYQKAPITGVFNPFNEDKCCRGRYHRKIARAEELPPAARIPVFFRRFREMNPQIKQLIPAMVSYINDHDGYVTKTKLLKLLYLFDVEFYRTHRKLFTGFSWKFFHLGPWAREFDRVVNDLVAEGVLLQIESARQEYDAKFLRTESRFDFSRIFSSLKEEAPLRVVLNTWADRPTGEILDYVYFHTEPMEQGIRNEPLNFSVIADERPEKYSRSASGISHKEIAKAKKQFASKIAALPKPEAEARFKFTPPKYDDEFLNALAKLDAAEQ
jgi:hypothetical protein